MQTKRYEAAETQTIPNATGVLNLTITNEENRKANFHGIRCKGTIMGDPNEGTAQFSKGYITLMCIEQSAYATPTILSDTDLEDNQGIIVASEIYQTYAGGAIDSGEQMVRHFDIILGKTSRTCPKDGRIILQISNNSSLTDVIVSAMISTFETQG